MEHVIKINISKCVNNFLSTNPTTLIKLILTKNPNLIFCGVEGGGGGGGGVGGGH